MKKTVTIFIDGEEKVVAAGLTIRHLLTPGEAERVRRGDLAIVDGRGQERGLDGALLEGTVLSRQARRPAR